MTYAAPVTVDVEYTRGRELVVRRGRTPGTGALLIGRLPIMLRSDRCVLRGKSDDELAALRECPLDPGGYFVVRGAEKVVLIQEQLSKNRVLVDRDANGAPTASVTSSTAERKSKTSIVLRGGRPCVRHNAFADDVSAVLVMRAMGAESDEEIVQLVGSEPALLRLLLPALRDARKEGVRTQADALDALGARVKSGAGGGGGGGGGMGGNSSNNPAAAAAAAAAATAAAAAAKARRDGAAANGAPSAAVLSQLSRGGAAAAGTSTTTTATAMRPARSRADEARDILAHVLLCHVSCRSFDFRRKLRHVAWMVRRTLAACLDPSLIDDRDYYGNKRLELAGSLLGLLFEDLFKRLNADLRRQADAMLSKASRAGAFDAAKMMRTDTITAGMEAAIASGNWTIRRFRMERKGVTQVLNRLSFIATLGMMTRITSQFEKTRKVSGPRALQPSQWGMLCPADTPEGESCGLVKHLALAAHVTTDGDAAGVAAAAAELGVEPAEDLSGAEMHARGSALVFLNGEIMGVHASPDAFVAALRRLRRSGSLGQFVSVCGGAAAAGGGGTAGNVGGNGGGGNGGGGNGGSSGSGGGGVVHIACDGGRVCRPLIVCRDSWDKVVLRELRKRSRATKGSNGANGNGKNDGGANGGGSLLEKIYASSGSGPAAAASRARARGPAARDPLSLSTPARLGGPGCPLLTEEHTAALKAKKIGFGDLLRAGVVEFLDVNEENDALVALDESKCVEATTHVEIEPCTLLGVVAGLIPYPHHNQSPRNTYQCAMGKQAMGNVGLNQLDRMDTLLYLLAYPQKPLLSTATVELVGFDRLGVRSFFLFGRSRSRRGKKNLTLFLFRLFSLFEKSDSLPFSPFLSISHR